MRKQTLGVTGAAVTATALAGSVGTDPDSRWYRSLRKPAFQPPPVAFPVVWTAVYGLIAAGSAEALDGLEDTERRDFAVALGANLGLNAAWTWCFFRAHRPWLAAAESAVLTASTADLARRARRALPRAHALLSPYLGWTAFATLLATRIAQLNRR